MASSNGWERDWQALLALRRKYNQPQLQYGETFNGERVDIPRRQWSNEELRDACEANLNTKVIVDMTHEQFGGQEALCMGRLEHRNGAFGVVFSKRYGNVGSWTGNFKVWAVDDAFVPLGGTDATVHWIASATAYASEQMRRQQENIDGLQRQLQQMQQQQQQQRANSAAGGDDGGNAGTLVPFFAGGGPLTQAHGIAGAGVTAQNLRAANQPLSDQDMAATSVGLMPSFFTWYRSETWGPALRCGNGQSVVNEIRVHTTFELAARVGHMRAPWARDAIALATALFDGIVAVIRVAIRREDNGPVIIDAAAVNAQINSLRMHCSSASNERIQRSMAIADVADPMGHAIAQEEQRRETARRDNNGSTKHSNNRGGRGGRGGGRGGNSQQGGAGGGRGGQQAATGSAQHN